MEHMLKDSQDNLHDMVRAALGPIGKCPSYSLHFFILPLSLRVFYLNHGCYTLLSEQVTEESDYMVIMSAWKWSMLSLKCERSFRWGELDIRSEYVEDPPV